MYEASQNHKKTIHAEDDGSCPGQNQLGQGSQGRRNEFQDGAEHGVQPIHPRHGQRYAEALGRRHQISV